MNRTKMLPDFRMKNMQFHLMWKLDQSSMFGCSFLNQKPDYQHKKHPSYGGNSKHHPLPHYPQTGFQNGQFRPNCFFCEEGSCSSLKELETAALLVKKDENECIKWLSPCRSVLQNRTKMYSFTIHQLITPTFVYKSSKWCRCHKIIQPQWIVARPQDPKQ